MNEASQIQIAYPSEPDWKKVSSQTLVELVNLHQDEPSCAQCAISELKARRHPQTESLCSYLLASETTDKWLRAGALSHLLSINPLAGLDTALGFIEDCEFEVLEEVIEALNYEHQGNLTGLVHSHPIVQRVKNRLAQHGAPQATFGKLFTEYFGV